MKRKADAVEGGDEEGKVKTEERRDTQEIGKRGKIQCYQMLKIY